MYYFIDVLQILMMDSTSISAHIIRLAPRLRDGFMIVVGQGSTWSLGEGFSVFQADRPRDINLDFAVADFEGEANFWVHTANTGTSSLYQDVPDVVSDKAGEIQPNKVQVTTLPSIIAQYAPSRHIHFLKIDAEGAEEPIIKATDWKRHRPEVIVVESTEPYTNIRRKESWQDILQEQNYTMAYFDGVNDFWVRAESEHLLTAFTLPINVLDNFQMYDPQVDFLREMVQAKSDEIQSQATELAIAREQIAQLSNQISSTQSASMLRTFNPMRFLSRVISFLRRKLL